MFKLDSFKASPAPSPGLEVKGLRVSYSGSLWRKNRVLTDLNLSIGREEGLLVAGPSGAVRRRF